MALDYKWVCPLCGKVIHRSSRLALVEERARHLRDVHGRKGEGDVTR